MSLRWVFLLLERAYAKINLTLDVLGKRSDGYHAVDMVMQTIDLSDSVWMEEQLGDGITLESNISHIPRDNRNLAYMAAERLMQHIGQRRGLRIRIDKQIPVAAGLAGGSADAAAVLRGLNRLWSLGLSLSELATIGADIGSDVPFCVYRGCAIASGRGEKIERIQHNFCPWVLLVKPAVFVSTADIYRGLTKSEYSPVPTSANMVEALRTGKLDLVQQAITNDLRNVTYRVYPEVSKLALRVHHVTGSDVHMSGSGPTLFCLAPNQNVGQRMVNALRGFTREVYLCRIV
jgi:4-diphosphocytidyl-2-C-methyl-D-erythritol kinase